MKLGGVIVGLLWGFIAGAGYGELHAAAALRGVRSCISSIRLPVGLIPARTFTSEPRRSMLLPGDLARLRGAQIFIMPPNLSAEHGPWVTAEMKRVLGLLERTPFKAADTSCRVAANALCMRITSRLNEFFGEGGVMSVEGFVEGRPCTIVVGGDAYKKIFPAGVAFTSLLAAESVSTRMAAEGPGAAMAPVCEVTTINLVFPPGCSSAIVERFRASVVPRYRELLEAWQTVELNGTFFMYEDGEGLLVPFFEADAATMRVRTVGMSLDLVLPPGGKMEIRLVHPALK